jgi:beta-glucosidase
MSSPGTKPNFIYGVATSSYQIEGAINDDGAGISNWTAFCRINGTVAENHSGDIACDHYNLWPDDIRLMQEMEVQSYRFSISWSRIFPDNSGIPNKKGIEHYQNLTKSLIKAGIDPMITLYHWDLPQWLEEQGGWSNPDIIGHFSKYANVLVEHLSPYCSKWLTLNEPWVFMHKGFITGEHAPGHQDLAFAAKAYVNILRAHSAAVQVMKSTNHEIKVGVACNLTHIQPYSSTQADVTTASLQHSYQNELFLDPWFLGEIPEVAFELFSDFMPPEWRFDASELMISHDFMGVNYYTRSVVRYKSSNFLNTENAKAVLPTTSMGWEIYPEGFTSILDWCYKRYQTPIYVTENGAAFDDELVNNEKVEDDKRIEYLKNHLHACHQSVRNGADIRGYYAWSLLDNFEWELGYLKRFGLIHVDFNTQKRTIKKSGYFYRDFIRKSDSAKLSHQFATEQSLKS